MSAEVPRRQTIYRQLNDYLLGKNCWPDDGRDEILRNSRFALNVHQDQHPYCEPLRFALFAAYGLPIMSEHVMDAWPYGGDTMAFARYDQLVTKFKGMMDGHYQQWHEMGARCRELMIGEFEFGRIVREAVSQSTESWR